MKIKGALISQLSGKLGGLVAASAKGGIQYLRRRPSAKQLASSLQEVVRGVFRTLSQRWSQNLTVGQRASWSAYAANVSKLDGLGQTIHVSGSNWYVGNNAPRMQCNSIFATSYDIADDMTGTFDLGNPTQFQPGFWDVSIDTVGNATLAFSTPTTPLNDNSLNTDDVLLLYASVPFAAGRANQVGSNNLVYQCNGSSNASIHNFTLASGLHVTGSMPNQTFTLRMARKDGRLSSPFRVTVSSI